MTIAEIDNKTIKILIVEDYKLTRVGLTMALNSFEKLKVVGEAQDGSTALKLIGELKPDIILMDLGLPDMNGLEVTQKVYDLSPKSKVIILTSHGQEEEVMASLGLGAKAYCMKDISPETLALVIENIMQGGCWLDPEIANFLLNTLPLPENFDFINHSEQRQKVQLTEREVEVLKLLVQGKSNTEIAKELIVSVHTAKAHVCSILQKLYVEDRVQAAVKAVREHLV